MVTIKDVAKECGVSIATVSNIFNEKGRVSATKRQMILDKAAEMGYVPNTIAKNLKEKSTKTIGIITEDLTVFHSAEIIDGIHEKLEEAGYHFLVGNLRLYKKYGNSFYHGESYKKQVEEEFMMMRSKRVDGVIYVAAHCRKLSFLPYSYGIPIILSYCFSERFGQDSIIYNDEQAAYEAIMELLCNHHFKIGVIAGEKESFHTRNRLKGVLNAFMEAGIEDNRQYIEYADWNRRLGYEAAERLFKRGIRAFFCMSDVMAAGVYDFANEHHYIIGKDISVIGFDNRDFASAFHPGLTTMALPLHEIGRETAESMLKLLPWDESKVNFNEPEKIRQITCKLVKRRSICEI